MPDVTGMPLMDAMVLLENMGLMVSANTVGKVKSIHKKRNKVNQIKKYCLKFNEVVKGILFKVAIESVKDTDLEVNALHLILEKWLQMMYFLQFREWFQMVTI